MGKLKQNILQAYSKDEDILEIQKVFKKRETEITIQEVKEDKEKENRQKSLMNGRCVYCNKPLTRTTFRSPDGEVEGWTTECVFCNLLYEER
jgi:hypothetical protein